ncbi:DNA-binding domain-containing protein [Qipengyuania sp. 6B39]|uniref:HvfC/BufC N-terminal domain-containing protein n=1 Tax=Qipengyuania proteolytica TaxID=2867239 RepID=UPI001C8B0661|nr:DNA-binding domain-containing protein [Qipengyuania proteolytica]MBX7494991.1 DNA-binding domain-containing protein [Qipengyuania proteolytica]
MTALAELQEGMLARILADELPLPHGWTARHEAGLEIYRNNYRTALVEALRSTFERTERLVGEESFRRAAAHHCIAHPPTSWTLDLAGAGFPDTCAELFANDPDVEELAALEWAMHRAFPARDAEPLDTAGFAATTAEFGEADWIGLLLDFLPGLSLVRTRHDLVGLWSSLATLEGAADVRKLDEPQCAVVWREGERPVFVLRPLWEGGALAALAEGGTFGEACALLVDELGEERAVTNAGAMLARWLADGIIAGIAQ